MDSGSWRERTVFEGTEKSKEPKKGEQEEGGDVSQEQQQQQKRIIMQMLDVLGLHSVLKKHEFKEAYHLLDDCFSFFPTCFLSIRLEKNEANSR
jgi:hypothetical protein